MRRKLNHRVQQNSRSLHFHVLQTRKKRYVTTKYDKHMSRLNCKLTYLLLGLLVTYMKENEIYTVVTVTQGT